MDNHTITALVYDTLMGNDILHETLDLSLVSEQEVEEHRGRILFVYNGREVNISVSSVQI